MKSTNRKAIMKPLQHKFDFEIGYLVKSPCRDCFDQKNLPGCLREIEDFVSLRQRDSDN